MTEQTKAHHVVKSRLSLLPKFVTRYLRIPVVGQDR